MEIFSSFKKSKFILQQKGSINDISDLSVNVSDEELTCILGKFYYLQGLCRDLFSKTSAELLQNYQKEDKEISENIFFKNIRLDSGSENDCYEEFFDGFAPAHQRPYGIGEVERTDYRHKYVSHR